MIVYAIPDATDRHKNRGFCFVDFVDQHLTNDDAWRGMLGASAVPGVLLLVAMAPMPDTPRWLIGKGRRDDGGLPVLKNLVDRLLRQRGDVLAFHSAPATQGGTGAVVVLLARR